MDTVKLDTVDSAKTYAAEQISLRESSATQRSVDKVTLWRDLALREFEMV